MDPERTQQLIDAYRQVEVPPAGVEDRMLDAVRERIASGTAPDAAVDLSPAAVVVPSRLPWLAIAGVGAGAVVAALTLLGPQTDPPVPAPSAPAPTVVAETAPPPEPPREEVPQVVESREVVADTDVSPEPAPAPEPEPARVRPTRSPVDPVETVETVDAEVDLIKRARGALRDGNGKRALRLLAEHRRRFADGVMVELREVFRVEALCAVGRTDDASVAARTFLARYPSSPYAGRVTEACAP